MRYPAPILALAVLLSGCMKDPAAALSWVGQDPPPVVDLHVEPPYMEPEPVGLHAGDTAPFEGVLLSTATGSYYLALEDMHGHAVGAYQDERRARLGDRQEAEEVLRLTVARWTAQARLRRDVALAVAVPLAIIAGALGGFGLGQIAD